MAFIVAAIPDTATRGMIEAALAGLGHTVVFFRGGVPGVAEVLAGIPALVILDARLVDKGVLHVFQAMRAHPSRPLFRCWSAHRQCVCARACWPGRPPTTSST